MVLHSRNHGAILRIENFEKQINDDFILNSESKLIQSIERKHQKIATPLPREVTHEGQVSFTLHPFYEKQHTRASKSRPENQAIRSRQNASKKVNMDLSPPCAAAHKETK
jgi:hypothetical protein